MAFKKGQSGNAKGRPVGTIIKPRFSDYVSEKDMIAIVAKAIEMAKSGNEAMIKFVGEQHFGKAMQPVEADLRGNLTLSFDPTFKK